MYVCEKIKKGTIVLSSKDFIKDGVLDEEAYRKERNKGIVFTDEMLDVLWLTDAYIDHFYKLSQGDKREIKNGVEVQCSERMFAVYLKNLYHLSFQLMNKSSTLYGERFYFYAMGRPTVWLSPDVWELTKYPALARFVFEMSPVNFLPPLGLGYPRLPTVGSEK